MARAVLLLAMTAVVLGGCGDSGGSAGATTNAAKAACAKPALLQALRALGTGSPAVQTLRCARGYAFTRVRDGGRRAVVLWHDVAGRWTQVARDVAGACPPQAASRALCTAPAADPALRRCTNTALHSGLRADVVGLRTRITRLRCDGGYANTRFVINDCRAGEARNAYTSCERARVAAWRRGPARWQLIMYRPQLDCADVLAADPKFPPALCR